MNAGFPFLASDTGKNLWLCELDARVRLVAGLILIVLISVILNPLSYSLLSATLLALAFAVKPQWQVTRMLIWPAIIMVLLTLTLHLLFNRSTGAVVVAPLGFPIRAPALITGLLYSWRVVLFLLAALCLTRLISPEDFAEGIWRLLKPFSELGMPVNEIGMALLITIRFIPTIFQQYHQIVFAQRARGATFGGNMLARVRQIIPLLVPITAAAIRRSDILADALIVRGWGISRRRTYYNDHRLRLRDYLALGLVLVWGGIVISVGV